MNKLLCFFFCFVFSVAASAQIYKWTDENGKVHYSDKAPEKQLSVEKIKLRKEQKPNQKSDSERRSLENTQRFLKVLEEEKAIKRKKEKEQAKKREKTRAYCQRLEKEISIYKKGYAIVRYGQDGGHEYLTDEEIAVQMSNFEQKWKENCEGLTN